MLCSYKFEGKGKSGPYFIWDFKFF